MQIFTNKTTFLLFILFLLVANVWGLRAQETLVVGQIVDAGNHQPIANVNVFFKNTPIGMKSDTEGYFMLRTQGDETTVVFSCIGYQTQELRLKKGQSVGTQIEMKEAVSELGELMVLPGTNPALDLMKRVRAARVRNNIRGSAAYSARLNEQKVVMLSKLSSANMSDKLFAQFSKSILNPEDSSKMIPLFMSESDFSIVDRKVTAENVNIFKSDARFEQFLQQLTGGITADLNFYQHTVTLFNKEFISPLSDVANGFYKFYLTDSIVSPEGLIYKVDFKSSNKKNLAFNGTLYIDSASKAVRQLTASVPASANINFVHKLNFSQSYRNENGLWLPDSSLLAVSMQLQLPGDTVYRQLPGVFISCKLKAGEVLNKESMTQFAGTAYKAEDLNTKLSLMNQTPLMRTARWVADVVLTGYAQFGKIDIGKVQNIARLTDQEGLKLIVPFRTNEHLWQNVSIGGYAGYAFGNKSVPYSAFTSVKLPFGRRNILRASYTNDYRRIDYDYDDYFLRENPLVSGDEDIAGTLLSFKSSDKVSKRHETELGFSSDIVPGVELYATWRSNKVFSSSSLPFTMQAVPLGHCSNQTLSLTGRFSFGQRYYNDHLQRIYADTKLPVIYATMLAGKYSDPLNSGYYGRFMTTVSQTVPFGFGSWRYIAYGGIIAGKVPYHLLFIPQGSETSGYTSGQFSSVRYMEYASDTYIALHNEINLNGVILNYIPLIKHLNLREMFSFKLLYGTRRSSNSTLTDIPASVYVPDKCYAEVGVGVSNIFRLFTVQSVWRLSDLNHPTADRWALKTGISVKF